VTPRSASIKAVVLAFMGELWRKLGDDEVRKAA
jgi:hypothetical protein